MCLVSVTVSDQRATRGHCSRVNSMVDPAVSDVCFNVRLQARQRVVFEVFFVRRRSVFLDIERDQDTSDNHKELDNVFREVFLHAQI